MTNMLVWIGLISMLTGGVSLLATILGLSFDIHTLSILCSILYSALGGVAVLYGFNKEVK